MSEEASYRKVNYLLRLRKQIERKIMIEILQSLNRHPKINISEYCYFGLGSIYYADFILFHKFLKINNMISIDSNVQHERRFRFNKPYFFIKFYPEFSTEFMTKDELDWSKPLIIWMDYDSKPTIMNSRWMLKDLLTVASNAKSYDFFIITIESDLDFQAREILLDLSPDDDDYNIRNYLPPQLTIDDLDPEGIEHLNPKSLPKTLNHLIKDCIKTGMSRRPKSKRLQFLQIFNFWYKDTAPMYTFGCIFLPKNGKKEFEDFCSNYKIGIYASENLEKIDCPIITPKEKYKLDYCIDLDRTGQSICLIDFLTEIGLDSKMIERYSRFYKYYPQFFEAIY